MRLCAKPPRNRTKNEQKRHFGFIVCARALELQVRPPASTCGRPCTRYGGPICLAWAGKRPCVSLAVGPVRLAWAGKRSLRTSKPLPLRKPDGGDARLTESFASHCSRRHPRKASLGGLPSSRAQKQKWPCPESVPFQWPPQRAIKTLQEPGGAKKIWSNLRRRLYWPCLETAPFRRPPAACQQGPAGATRSQAIMAMPTNRAFSENPQRARSSLQEPGGARISGAVSEDSLAHPRGWNLGFS